MANNKNLSEHGRATQFPINDATKGGRKKKIYTILKEKGYQKDDIETAFGEIAFYDENELKSLIAKKDIPIIARIVATQFLGALTSKDWSKISEILKHVLGSPTQKISANVTGDIIPIVTKEV